MLSSPSVTCILGIVILIVHLNEVTYCVRSGIAQGTLGRQKEDQVTLTANVLSGHGKRQEQFVTEQRKIRKHQEIKHEN